MSVLRSGQSSDAAPKVGRTTETSTCGSGIVLRGKDYDAEKSKIIGTFPKLEPAQLCVGVSAARLRCGGRRAPRQLPEARLCHQNNLTSSTAQPGA
jgi:hypothetical protein